MTALLVLKEEIERIYGEYCYVITVVLKACLTFIMLLAINQKIGYMGALQSLPLVLIISILCGFLHSVTIMLVGAVFILANLCSLSIEIAGVALLLLVTMLCLYVRLSAGNTILLVLVPLAFFFQIPYVVPLLVGLMLGPTAIVAVGCGVIIYYFIEAIRENVVTINGLSDGDFMTKLRIAIDGILDNDTMLVVLLAFVVTTFIVYVLSKLSIDYAWTVAIVTGAIVDLLFIFIGDFLYNTDIVLITTILSSIVSVLIAMIVHFFQFNVDYNRTEKVQFEDEEYYYYVKAIPKLSMPTQTKTVKKITTSGKPTYRNNR